MLNYRRRFTVAALASAAFLLAPWAAFGQNGPVTSPPSGAPVTINSCAPMIDQSQGPSVAGLTLASPSSGIQIEFVNDSTKTADLVNFSVTSNGSQFIIRDVGTFSSGVSINHKYRNGAGQSFVLPAFIAPHIQCAVASVRFTDGSVWRKGDAAAAGVTESQPEAIPGAPISANPSSLNIDRATDSELFLVTGSGRVTAFKETDNCANIASVFVAATGQSSATYTVKPLASGSCTATIADEAGNTLAVPITIR